MTTDAPGPTTTPTIGEIELAFLERFFLAHGLEPYPVQEQALARIFRGESVLVTVPTGTGKTVLAKAALYRALEQGQTAVYTTPLRALTEEKFRELQVDFGEDKVGFATGDYKVNPKAPIQVVVAEILWNRVYGDRQARPADVVVMDEGHYFNDPERGYVWEQSIIGLDPRTQLVILSATVGEPEQFCAWVYSVRRVDLELVSGNERRVPLYHEYREEYLLDVVKELAKNGDVPTIIFTFGREQCFERARIIKSCPRFTTDEERARITEFMEPVLLEGAGQRDLKPLLLHGIGIHHAGILPRYKQLVEKLTMERLLRFIVSTETIAAGLNLPAKRVIFPVLGKHIRGKSRLLTSAEYHQMAGRAGRPQFDTEGIAITMAPESVVQDARKELRDAEKSRRKVEPVAIWRSAYARARASSQAKGDKGDLVWDGAAHQALVQGKPAALKSQTQITPEQVLALGLPDLLAEPPSEPLPAYMELNVRTVIRNQYVDERTRQDNHALVDRIVANLRALGVLDEHGTQIAGDMIRKIRGFDGTFVWWLLQNRSPTYELLREACEYLCSHDVIWKILSREGDEKRREWIKNRLRERRREETQVQWEDVEAEYEKAFPRELTLVEKAHQEFVSLLPHPELHGGKVAKNVWQKIEEEDHSFAGFVKANGLEHEEGSLFSYLARVMKIAKMVKDASGLEELVDVEGRIRRKLGTVDERVLAETD